MLHALGFGVEVRLVERQSAGGTHAPVAGDPKIVPSG